MKQKLIYLWLFFALVLPQANAAEYSIDPDHTSVTFKVRHLGISSVTGKFTAVEGAFSFDPLNIAASQAWAKIGANSVNTEQKKRDEHLRSPDFFDVNKYPLIEFKSKKVTSSNANLFKVEGDLTIRGVTKAVVLDVQYLGTVKDPWGNEKSGFAAETTVNRKDFGILWNKVMDSGGFVVGDDVKISLEVEATKKSA